LKGWVSHLFRKLLRHFMDSRGAVTLVKNGESSLMQISAAHRKNLLKLINLMDDKMDPASKIF